MRRVFTNAHRIQEEVGGSPLVTVSLYRLLQALVLRVFLGSDDECEVRNRWVSMWRGGRFDPAAVTRYFDGWQGEKERFDLLHAERPFYQHPEPNTKTVKPPTQLFAGAASGNNPTIFDHSVDADAPAITLAEAARARPWAAAAPRRSTIRMLRLSPGPCSGPWGLTLRGPAFEHAVLI